MIKKSLKYGSDKWYFNPGLLGMLLVAKERELIDSVKPVLDKLIYEIGFRISPKLYQEILKRAKE